MELPIFRRRPVAVSERTDGRSLCTLTSIQGSQRLRMWCALRPPKDDSSSLDHSFIVVAEPPMRHMPRTRCTCAVHSDARPWVRSIAHDALYSSDPRARASCATAAGARARYADAGRATMLRVFGDDQRAHWAIARLHIRRPILLARLDLAVGRRQQSGCAGRTRPVTAERRNPRRRTICGQISRSNHSHLRTAQCELHDGSALARHSTCWVKRACAANQIPR